MKIYKTKSLSPLLTDKELEFDGAMMTSFISFERAVKESEEFNRMDRKVKGYQVTKQGIVLILE